MKNRTAFAAALLSIAIAFGVPATCRAQEKTPGELAAETEAACNATAKTKPTPAMVMEKVDAACKLLEKDGKAALAKFKGKDSAFVFAGTYIWVHDMECVMLMHPLKYKMEGQPLLGFQDSNGKKFFIEMNELCKTKGAGWVDYMWPKPGEKTASLKVSYVKKALCDGKEVVVGCGVYDMTLDDIKKATEK